MQNQSTTANKKLSVGDVVNFTIAPTDANWTVDSIVLVDTFPTNFVNIVSGNQTRMVDSSFLFLVA